MKRAKKWLVGILAALSLSCIGMACASCDLSAILNTNIPFTSAESASSAPVSEDSTTSIADSTEEPKNETVNDEVVNDEVVNDELPNDEEETGTAGLAYCLLEDGTYAVEIGTAKYIRNIVIPSTHNGKTVTGIAIKGFGNE
jgi:hypothetical protein